MMNEELLDIEEFAHLTHYSARQIRQFCIDGKIKGAGKLGSARKWLIPRSAIETLGDIETPSNWIDAYKVKTGKYPSLPSYLVAVANNYKPGEPISKEIEVVTPSAQWLNKLLPSQQREWRQLVEWLGKDPEDLLAQMRMMLPKNPPGVERKRWKPHEQRTRPG